MSKDSVRASGAEGPGRLGEGRVYADTIGMEPILDQQGNTSGVSPSERTFSAPYIVTVTRGVQLCSGSSRYFCRLSGLNQGSTPLRAIGPITIGMEPILDQQGNTSGVLPSERTFSAPYIVTVMRGVQLCSGSSRYFCRLSGLNQGSTPLRAIGPILNRPRSRWRMALSPAWCETSPSSLRRCASTPFIPVPLATSPQ